jgi:DNA-binding MarR family transcriptional regulator
MSLPIQEAGDMKVAPPLLPEAESAHPHRTNWTFLTNHAHVLIALARNPDLRVRDLAAAVKITERAVQQILTDLEEEGVIEREREGRRNHYVIIDSARLRHPNEQGAFVGDLLALLKATDEKR